MLCFSSAFLLYLQLLGYWLPTREVAGAGPTDKLSVGMDRHRLAHPLPHGDAAPRTPLGGGGNPVPYMGWRSFLATTLLAYCILELCFFNVGLRFVVFFLSFTGVMSQAAPDVLRKLLVSHPFLLVRLASIMT